MADGVQPTTQRGHEPAGQGPVAFAIEARGAILLATSALSLLGFVAIAAGVAGGDARAIDESILLALRSPTDPAVGIGPKWLAHYMRDITALGGFPVLSILVLSVAGYLWIADKSVLAFRIFAISLGGWALSHLTKLVFLRPRPDIVPHGAEFYAASFPSGHAMTAAVVYLTLGAAIARATPERSGKMFVMAIAAAISVLIGVSRVYLGVHWPSDVLAGWALGGAWVGFAWAALKAYSRRTAAAL